MVGVEAGTTCTYATNANNSQACPHITAPPALAGKRLKHLRNVVMHPLHAKLCQQELSHVIEDLAHATLPTHALTSRALLEEWRLRHGVLVGGYRHGHPDAVRVRQIILQSVVDNSRIGGMGCRAGAGARRVLNPCYLPRPCIQE
jgi:hypothetical protein